jgi:hypothetical protein
MSHFTTIKTQFTDAVPLEKALADVAERFGLSAVRRNSIVSGWRGITTMADLVVSTRNEGYDLGFTRDAGHFVLVGDWYGIKDIKQDSLTQALAQRYAYHATVQKLVEEQGFSLVEEEEQETGAIHLVLRRAI